jgi:hypothetical protein
VTHDQLRPKWFLKVALLTLSKPFSSCQGRALFANRGRLVLHTIEPNHFITMHCLFRFLIVAITALAFVADAAKQQFVRQRELQSKVICPLFPCLDPCFGKCRKLQTCTIRTPPPSIPGCPECPVFDKCVSNKVVCPLLACIDPCFDSPCGAEETCTVRSPAEPKIKGCPDCSVFDKCVPKIDI